MWDLAPLSVFINHSFYDDYLSSQCETRVLQVISTKNEVQRQENRLARMNQLKTQWETILNSEGNVLNLQWETILRFGP
jgi:hypothetical protein